VARKLRVEYPGVIYRVMNRGDRCEPIFKDEADRRRCVETLGEACAKTGWQVHAYVGGDDADFGVDCGAFGQGHAGLSEPPAVSAKEVALRVSNIKN